MAEIPVRQCTCTCGCEETTPLRGPERCLVCRTGRCKRRRCSCACRCSLALKRRQHTRCAYCRKSCKESYACACGCDCGGDALTHGSHCGPCQGGTHGTDAANLNSANGQAATGNNTGAGEEETGYYFCSCFLCRGICGFWTAAKGEICATCVQGQCLPSISGSSTGTGSSGTTSQPSGQVAEKEPKNHCSCFVCRGACGYHAKANGGLCDACGRGECLALRTCVCESCFCSTLVAEQGFVCDECANGRHGGYGGK